MQTIIITGGNSGLGFACAQALLKQSATPLTVILACRDPRRADASVQSLDRKMGNPDSHVETMSLDLASLKSVRAFADKLKERLAASDCPPLRGLICNAGVQAGAEMSFTKDKFETTFGVNHLGHFLLVNLLRPLLTAPARVIVVASGVHDPAQKTGVPAPAWNKPQALARGELGPAAANDKPSVAGQRRYSTSKLANVLFTYELAERLQQGITVNAFDPGLMPGTRLVREAPAPLRLIWHHVLPHIIPVLRRLMFANTHTVAESGAALATLMTDPKLGHVTGKYFEGTHKIPSSEDSYDVALAEDLWSASEKLTGLKT